MAGTPKVHIDFVCTGNICRSPMAEAIMRAKLAEAGLSDVASVTSCGIEDYHVGQHADRRALDELKAHGYDGSSLRASQVSPFDLAADLLVPMTTQHRSQLIVQGADPEKVMLLRDFDPNSAPNSSVADPYYGGPEGFAATRKQIEAASDGIIDWVRAQVDD